MIDYLMVRKRDRCLMKDMKVISSEECITEHRMFIGRLVIPMKQQKKIVLTNLFKDSLNNSIILHIWN